MPSTGGTRGYPCRVDEFDQMKAALLANCPAVFGPDGPAAVQQHKLLASDVHRAAKLNAHKRDEKEGQQWVRYVTEHFPESRNGAEDAVALWTDWRTALLKRNTVGPLVTITHGQSHAHWYREPSGALCLNIEDLWDDYESSVEHFVAHARQAERDRRDAIIKRWKASTFDIRQLIGTDLGMITSASAVSSVTVIDLPPQLPPESE
jgi:hypothetical protein